MHIDVTDGHAVCPTEHLLPDFSSGDAGAWETVKSAVALTGG